MVTLGETVQDEIASDHLQQNKSPGSTSNEIKSGQEGASLFVSPKKESVELEKIEIAGDKLSAEKHNKEGNAQLGKTESSNEKQSGQEGATLSVPPKEESVELVKTVSSTLSASPKKESAELVKTENSSDKFSAAHCNKEVNTCVKTEGELENVQLGQSSDSKIKTEASVSIRESTPLPVTPGGVPQNIQQKQSSSFSGNETSGSTQGASLALIPVEVLDKSQLNQKSDAGNSAANRELSVYTSIAAKPLNSLQPTPGYNTGTGVLHRDQEVKTPSRIPDKASLDGYNWRKYGQKLVKGNEFVRSYYRCTHPNCAAKRQVERTHEGQITDTVYLGKHEHPKPQPSPRAASGSAQPVQAVKSDESSLAVGTDKSSSAPVPESRLAEPVETPQLSIPADDSPKGVTPQSYRTRDELDSSKEPESKKQKRDISSNIAMTPVEKSNGESKVVVQTMSEVDIVNDGFRWRKYGQKLVKGNPNPRSYYRCSNPGCPVKKHVERASHDAKLVITTYEGNHDHGTPPCRTVTPNTSGPTTDATDLNNNNNNNESRPKPEEKSATCVDMVVHISAN